MNDSEIDGAIKNAIISKKPVNELCNVAIMLRDLGKTQKEVEFIYNRYRVMYEDDDDETNYNNVLDAMDYIVGWCSVDQEIFPK